jgi:hypothetical protein
MAVTQQEDGDNNDNQDCEKSSHSNHRFRIISFTAAVKLRKKKETPAHLENPQTGVFWKERIRR